MPRDGKILLVSEEWVPDHIVQRSQVLTDLLSAQGATSPAAASWNGVKTWMARATALSQQAGDDVNSTRSWDDVLSNLKVGAACDLR